MLTRLPLQMRVLLATCASLLLNACGTPGTAPAQLNQELVDALRAKSYYKARALVTTSQGALTEPAALDLCIRFGDPDCVRFFLSRAGPDAQLDGQGATPLLRTVNAAPAESREAIVRLLLAAGARTDTPDRNGRAAADLARARGDRRLAELIDGRVSPTEAAAPAPATPLAAAPQAPSPQAAALSPAMSAAPDVAQRFLPAAQLVEAASTVDGGVQALRLRPLLVAGNTQFLSQTHWTPVSAASSGDAELIGFRFNADGTGQLLKVNAGTRRFDNLDRGYFAWDFHRGVLELFAISPNLAAWCASTGTNATQIGLECIEYSTQLAGPFPGVPDESLTPRRLSTNYETARDYLERAENRRRLVRTGSVRGVIESGSASSCKPVRQPRVALSLKPPSRTEQGDWFVFDPERFQLFVPPFGQACPQAEAQWKTDNDCRAGGRICHGAGGCAPGQVAVLAAVRGHEMAWLACGANYESARELALERCRERAECDCEVVSPFPKQAALTGGATAASCQTPPARGSRPAAARPASPAGVRQPAR